MPMGQIDIYRVENPEEFVNRKLKCVITEVDREERNLVVSRRGILERERDAAKEQTMASLAEGDVREGIVRTIKPFGAFCRSGRRRWAVADRRNELDGASARPKTL
jgi:small subunit ribosomal protein S1